MENFVRLSETDIKDMSDEFSKQAVAQGQIAFGLRQTKLFVGIMHWVHDQNRCYQVASIQDIADAEEFKQLCEHFNREGSTKEGGGRPSRHHQ